MSTERIADEIKFAYWVPNVSGGLVTSDIEQRTSWDYEYNKKLASLLRSREPLTWMRWRMGSHTSLGASWKVRTVL